MVSRFIVVAALSIASVASTTAHAQSEAERSALARELFREGTEHLEAERFEEAADALGRAHELRPASGIAFNLGAAYEHLGRLVEALELMRTVSRDDEAPEHLRQLSNEALERIEPQLARLTIHVEGAPAGNVVKLDGREVLDAALDIATPTDPGEHVVELTRRGDVLQTQRITLDPGASETVTLRAALGASSPSNAANDATEADPATNAPESDGGGGVATKWWFWTLVVGVVAGGVVAGVVIATSGPEEPIQGTAGVVTWP